MRFADLTKDQAASLFAAGPVAALVPVGSVEPHGPHLPLGTDSIISESACLEAIPLLAAQRIAAAILPAVPYGVTDFASGFSGAVSVAGRALTAFLRALCESLYSTGFAHVCLVNNHLEPDQDQAVRAAIASFRAGRASVACPLGKRHARTLSDEFKSGACHAGRYETSLILAARPELVQQKEMDRLPPVPISLSTGIREGKRTFAEMGLADAYAGAPAEATAPEGRAQLALLGQMIFLEVSEAMARLEHR